MAVLPSFILAFEDGRIRAIREPRKYYIRNKQMNSEFQKSDLFSGNPPLSPPQTPGVGGEVYGGWGVKGGFL